MAAYSVGITRSAARELRTIEPKALLQNIVRRIEQLAGEPRPRGTQKLAGAESLYRLRQGAYRIVYEISDADRRVVVLRIAHRRDVYR